MPNHKDLLIPRRRSRKIRLRKELGTLKTLRIDEIQPGVTVAADVCNAAGGVLVGAGATLSEAHIRRLKIAGVDAVCVSGEPGPAAPLEMAPEARLAALELRFAGAADPVLLQIKEIVAARLTAMQPLTAP